MTDANCSETVRDSGPGRPQALTPDERRKRILEAARSEFFVAGYTATTMEQIARSCGMSKRSVYQVFSGKSEVFAALLQSMPRPDGPELPEHSDEAGVRAWIRATLVAFARYVLAPDQLSLARLIISEAGGAPEIAQIFYESHFAPEHCSLSRQMTQLQARGVLSSHDPEMLSEVLVSAALGACHLRMLVSGAQPGEEVEARTNERIDLILSAMWPEHNAQTEGCGKGTGKRADRR
ncbi:MAG: TetR/AcrR family transcriptional regulator [Cypionkella sp.]